MKAELKENLKKAGKEFLKMSFLLSLLIFLILLCVYMIRHIFGFPVCDPTIYNLLTIIADCLVLGFCLSTLLSFCIIGYLILFKK